MFLRGAVVEGGAVGGKTKWCRNAGQRERELQDWGMGHFVEKMSGFVSKEEQRQTTC